MSLPYLTDIDPTPEPKCSNCQDRGGMAIVVLAFGVVFAMGAGIVVGLKIGYQAGQSAAVTR